MNNDTSAWVQDNTNNTNNTNNVSDTHNTQNPEIKNQNFIYERRASLMTQTEMRYYTAIRSVLSENYILQPQINLASVIIRTDNAHFANELFRNADFGVFDKQYKPILLIEINDNSHNQKNRQARDIKVKNICQEAGIPLVTFWTNKGINPEYMQIRINAAIEESKNPVRVKHSAEKAQTKKGCYVATCVYGSYDCPSVWVLRRFRDEYLKKSLFGRAFIRFYYAVSPTAVRLFGEKKWFRNFFRKRLDKLVVSLKLKGVEDTNYYD